ncbi:glutamine amidotransferase [Candidatus Saccharibacteria bacterium]|nr:glutamine amidotransferase [Candidatus Saccharibacteria bacterium]
MTINILHLYPKEMNLYGDHGNILSIIRRCEWRGIKTNVIHYEPGDKLPEKVDIIFGGGGQDSGQGKIEKDLAKIGPWLKDKIEHDTPALLICGLYQLAGHYFETSEGQKIEGCNIIDITTIGGPTRLIGNITINTPEFGEVVGYENHSGLTKLGEDALPFGTVTSGAGNNGQDFTEGVRYHNCIGTYLHGPLLPKNPRITDFLIKKALENQTGKIQSLKPLNDQIELRAHKVAAKRPR